MYRKSEKQPDRLVEPAVAVRDERGREGDHEADRDGDRGELQVLEQCGLERVGPVVRTQPGQKRWFSVSHVEPAPKFGMTGPFARRASVITAR